MDKRNNGRRVAPGQIYYSLDRERLNLDRVVSRLRICLFVRTLAVVGCNVETRGVSRGTVANAVSRPGFVLQFTADGR